MEGQVEHLYFQEEQRFSLWIFIIPLLVFVPTIIIARVSTFGLFVAFIVGGVVLLVYSMKLVTKVDSDCLRIRFFPFARREIPLARIAHWEARTYHPIREYGGWGIRTGLGKGGALNAKGNRGVQLRFADGEELLIGSQRPEELASAITLAKSENRGP